jgi:membrane protease YdiL (CAAX protease family)
MRPFPQARRLKSFALLAIVFVAVQVLNGPQGGTFGSLLSHGFGFVVGELVFQGAFVGWTEEYLFRGSIQRVLNSRRGPRESGRRLKTGTLVASLLFGLGHFANLGLGQSLQDTLVQVLSAFVVGLILGIYYDVKDDLAGVAWLHNIADFVPLLLSF